VPLATHVLPPSLHPAYRSWWMYYDYFVLFSMFSVNTFRIFSIIITGSDEMYVNIAKLQNINTMVYKIIKTNIIKQQYIIRGSI